MDRKGVFARLLLALATALISLITPVQASSSTSPLRELARAEVSADGLMYTIRVDYDKINRGYVFNVFIMNTSDQPIELSSGTLRYVSLFVTDGNIPIWHTAINPVGDNTELPTMIPPGSAHYGQATWDGLDQQGQDRNLVSFELKLVHQFNGQLFWLKIHDVPTYYAICQELTSPDHGNWDIVPRDHWAYHALDYLVEQQALSGYPEDYFAGEHELYQCDFIIAIQRGLDQYELAPEKDDQIRIMLETLRAAFSEQIEVGAAHGLP